MANGKLLILGAMTVTVVETTVAALASDTASKVAPVRILIGGYLVTVALLIGSDVNEEVAQAFALLIMLASIFGPNGTTVAKVVTRVTGGKSKLTTSGGSGGGKTLIL